MREIESGGNGVRLIISFFLSSRRRHTRYICDWSSDVCSSDLAALSFGDAVKAAAGAKLDPSAPPGVLEEVLVSPPPPTPFKPPVERSSLSIGRILGIAAV